MRRLDVALCERLAKIGAAGDEQARRELVDHLYPYWLARIRAQKGVRALGQSPDHVLDIAARLVEKVMDPAVLRGYIEGQQQVSNPGFGQWIHKVTDNECASYVRASLGKSSRYAEHSGFTSSPKRLLNEVMASPIWEELGVRPPFTDIQTATELLRFADEELPKPQVAALRLWLEGLSFEEIGAQLNVTEEKSLALLRSALATLRRRFRIEATTQP